MKKSKKRTTLIWYLLNYLLISLANPVSFLVLVDLFGQELNQIVVLHIFSILFLSAFIIFCTLVMMSIL